MIQKYQYFLLAALLVLILLSIFVFSDRISYFWLLVPILSYILFMSYGAGIIQARMFTPSICQGETSARDIAITFDDGPHPEITPKVLDLLDEYNVKASFFCIGNQISRHPQMVKDIDRRGHLIGNHTFTHTRKMGWLSYEKVYDELASTEKIIYDTLGRKSRWFRPPFGVTNPTIGKAIRVLGYESIGWNIRSLDGRLQDEESIFKRIKKRLKPGGIILMHDIYPHVLPVLRNLLEYAKENNYNIVPLNKLIDNKPYE